MILLRSFTQWVTESAGSFFLPILTVGAIAVGVAEFVAIRREVVRAKAEGQKLATRLSAIRKDLNGDGALVRALEGPIEYTLAGLASNPNAQSDLFQILNQLRTHETHLGGSRKARFSRILDFLKRLLLGRGRTMPVPGPVEPPSADWLP